MSRHSDEVKYFLVVYDYDAGRLVEVEEFGTDEARAVEAYDAKERELQGPSSDASAIEVVLIGSDSRETLELTHANYFDAPWPRSKYFDLAPS